MEFIRVSKHIKSDDILEESRMMGGVYFCENDGTIVVNGIKYGAIEKLSDAEIDAIANKVLERILPIISDKGDKHNTCKNI